MMRIWVLCFLMCAVLALAALHACKKTPGSNCTEVRISAPGIGFSHNNGQQCQNCHLYQGIGPGCFYLSGSVYENNKIDAYKTGEVRLYTQPNGQGELKGTFYVDNRGNFYSTASIDWTDGYYVTFDPGSSPLQHMQTKITDGSCNRCHGEFNERIFVP